MRMYRMVYIDESIRTIQQQFAEKLFPVLETLTIWVEDSEELYEDLNFILNDMMKV